MSLLEVAVEQFSNGVIDFSVWEEDARGGVLGMVELFLGLSWLNRHLTTLDACSDDPLGTL